MFGMLLTGVSFGAMFALPFLDGVDLKIFYICFFAVTAGLAAGCGGTLSPSIQGDVIDYDEMVTGERKEGSYFAAWNFVYIPYCTGDLHSGTNPTGTVPARLPSMAIASTKIPFSARSTITIRCSSAGDHSI